MRSALRRAIVKPLMKSTILRQGARGRARRERGRGAIRRPLNSLNSLTSGFRSGLIDRCAPRPAARRPPPPRVNNYDPDRRLHVGARAARVGPLFANAVPAHLILCLIMCNPRPRTVSIRRIQGPRYPLELLNCVKHSRFS
ncbi:hypothetical protein EVAR_85343_1 [Eumeta japonica]|uniref:Uncharacterized protein n=1 Tax=Eumeta variegata TaxID=151549 RepID=A0A4C1WT66_EUMVA|nr:hypothetical protein EVAR_85343_1 [Eumeta japonica]